MNSMGVIREFNTKNFRVIVDAIDDYDIDLSFDDSGGVREKLESGELISFTARVRVICSGLGEVGSDYLGGCIYESLESFMDHRECGKHNKELAAAGENGRCGSCFADMIREAIREARAHLCKARDLKVRCVH